MSAIQILRERVAALMRQRGWTSNKALIEASGGRLTNGTLGRIRGDGENCQLSQVDELANVFGVQSWELLKPDGDLQAAPVRSASLGDVVGATSAALRNVPASRRRHIATLAAFQLAEAHSPEELAALDALAPGVQIGLPAINTDDQAELHALRSWRDAVFSMAEHEPLPARRYVADFLLKVDAALREKSHIGVTAEPQPPTAVR